MDRITQTTTLFSIDSTCYLTGATIVLQTELTGKCESNIRSPATNNHASMHNIMTLKLMKLNGIQPLLI